MRWFRRLHRDDRGSMPMAILATVIGLTVTAVMVPAILNQLQTTRTGIQRAHGLNAAQAGLDVALGQIQAANDGAGAGVNANLPCGPLTGLVGGGTARYRVTIDYLAADPQGHDEAWITANTIACSTGAGPASSPAYALLRAQGTDTSTGEFGTVPSRSLQATYAFRTTSQNAAGGLIHAYQTGSNDLCLDAGSPDPAVGTSVAMQPCSAGSARQSFVYHLNLTLILASSRTAARPLGLCLDAGAHAAGQVVRLQACATTTATTQQWIFTEYGNFEGATDATTADGFCLNVQHPNTQGSLLVLGSAATTTCRRANDSGQTFLPDAAVGTGPLGAYQRQLTTAGEFGRCVAVTGADVATAYVTAPACQPANVSWEQQWSLPAVAAGADHGTGAIETTAPAGTYCLQSPGSVAPSRYVTVAACTSSSVPLDMRWTVYTDTGDNATSYRIVDTYGYCLSPTDPTETSPDLAPSGIRVSKLIVAECSSSALQKWNAPTTALRTLPLKDITED